LVMGSSMSHERNLPWLSQGELTREGLKSFRCGRLSQIGTAQSEGRDNPNKNRKVEESKECQKSVTKGVGTAWEGQGGGDWSTIRGGVQMGVPQPRLMHGRNKRHITEENSKNVPACEWPSKREITEISIWGSKDSDALIKKILSRIRVKPPQRSMRNRYEYGLGAIYCQK